MDPLLAPQHTPPQPTVTSLSLARLVQHPLTTLFTWCVLAVATTLPLTITSLIDQATLAASHLDSALDFTVFLDPALSAKESQAIRDELSKRADIESVTLISKEEGLQEFREWSHLANALEHLPENPLPATLTVRPRLRSEQAIAPLMQGIKAVKGVQKIRADETWSQRFIALREALSMLGVWLFNASIVAAIIVSLTVLHLDLRSRYYALLTRVPSNQRLNWLRKICLFEGVWLSLVGSTLGILASHVLVWGIQPWISRLATTYHATFTMMGPDPTACAVAVGVSVVMGLFAGSISSRV